MFRILFILALIPNLAAAELSLRPSIFSYQATFDQCTINPALVSSVDCADSLHGAYVLHRAVVWAMLDCADVTLADCAAPFEGNGLPAVAARIAAQAGCDRSSLAALEAGDPLVPDHCITVITDILRDEGVVPFIQEITCAGPATDCHDLARIHEVLWLRTISTLSESDLTRVRTQTVFDTCKADGLGTLAFYDCGTNRYATIWADLAQQIEQEN
jgi:hypothetical protein